jgi:uncharacterized protein YciI
VHWLLLYDLADDYLERRTPLRPEHLALLTAAHERGELLMAGALPDPFDTAVLVFIGETGNEFAEALVKQDPYVREGAVTGWRIRQWNVVVGP